MRTLTRLFALGVFVALAFPGGAFAQIRTLVYTSAPISIGPHAVAEGTQVAASPQIDGSVVGMSANVVDMLGNPVPPTEVMLHHIVFAKIGVPDTTCSGIENYGGRMVPFQAQRFWAEGEEHFTLGLPDPYGYPNRAGDTWGMLYMLMNHHALPSVVEVRYTVRYAVGRRERP